MIIYFKSVGVTLLKEKTKIDKNDYSSNGKVRNASKEPLSTLLH